MSEEEKRAAEQAERVARESGSTPQAPTVTEKELPAGGQAPLGAQPSSGGGTAAPEAEAVDIRLTDVLITGVSQVLFGAKPETGGPAPTREQLGAAFVAQSRQWADAFNVDDLAGRLLAEYGLETGGLNPLWILGAFGGLVALTALQLRSMLPKAQQEAPAES